MTNPLDRDGGIFVIAEIGTGHLGDRSKAEELIRAAAATGTTGALD